MYAIVKINGHQYQISPQQTIEVDKITGQPGDLIHFSPLLVVHGKDVKVGKNAAQLEVVAKIVNQNKGKKIEIRRFQAKSRYRRHRGFRPQKTTLLISSIGTQNTKETSPAIHPKSTQVRKKRVARVSST